MSRRPPNVKPVKVPSIDEIIAQNGTPNQLRPIESPTLGAATAFGGVSLDSPTISSADVTSSTIPSRLMPPPPRPSTLATSSSTPSTMPTPAVPASALSEPTSEQLARRGSISPNKRRRAPEDDDEQDPSPPVSEGSTSGLAAAAASISSALGFGPAASDKKKSDSAAATAAPGAAAGAAAGAERVPKGPGGADDHESDEDERPGSPTKRQARAPAFGQAHALASGKAAAAASAAKSSSEPPPRTTVVDMFSPGMMRIPVFRIPALLTLPSGLCLAFAEARPHLHDSGVIDLVMRRSTDHGKHWVRATTPHAHHAHHAPRAHRSIAPMLALPHRAHS